MVGIKGCWVREIGVDQLAVEHALRTKKQIDPDCTAFGVQAHRYEMLPTITQAKLEQIESDLGFRLPEEYRDFILTIGNGGAATGYGLYSLEDALKDTEDSSLHLDADFDETLDLERVNILILCQHGCANDDFLILNGQYRGTVWTMIEWVGEIIPLLKESFDFTQFNGLPLAQRAQAEEHWLAETLAKPVEQYLTFNQWYQQWLNEAPVPNIANKPKK